MTPVSPDVFAFTSVRALLAAWVAAQPDGARDSAVRWVAKHLDVSRAHVWNLISNAATAQPGQVQALSRALALSEEQGEYLRRLVEMENAGPEALKEARLALWELHARHTGVPSAELAAILARESVPGADDGALVAVVNLLDQLGGCPAPRELGELLLAPPHPGDIASAVALAADGFSLGEVLTPRLLALHGPGEPGDAPTAGWHGLLDLARESLLRIPTPQRDFHAITWSSDGRAVKEVERVRGRARRELVGLVARTAQQPVERLHLVLFEQLPLSQILGRGEPKNRPRPQTSPAVLPPPGPSSNMRGGSSETGGTSGDTACLYLYLDLASYASAWVKARERDRLPCSATYLTRRMGLGRTLTNALTNGAARFRLKYVDAAARGFGWSAEERTYAEGLARYAEATDLEERAKIRHALVAFAAAHGVRTTRGEEFRALSHWAASAITALSFLPSFRTNPAWISCALRGRIRWQDAQALTETLLATGRLEERDGGPARPAVYETRSKEAQPELARYALHDSALRLMQTELQFPTLDQLFGGWVLALPEAAVPELRAIMDRVKADVLACYQAADARAAAGQGPLDRVMLAGFQVFPLTQPLAISFGPRPRRR